MKAYDLGVLYETPMHSPTITALLPALAAAIADMPDPRKNAANPHFKNKYANLGEVMECIAGPLAANKLMVTQTMEGDKILRTRLWHVPSGEWLDSVMVLQAEKAGMQPMGSAITYARRYALKSLFGMVDVDDDGKRSQTPAKAAKEAPAPVASFGAVEDAIASLESLTKPEAVKLWEERVRMSGFTGSDRQQALNARNAKMDELKRGAGK